MNSLDASSKRSSASFPAINLNSYRLSRNPVRPHSGMLQQLGLGCLFLPDFELTLKELPAIHKFLQTKRV
jgi:hypothetical protein